MNKLLLAALSAGLLVSCGSKDSFEDVCVANGQAQEECACLDKALTKDLSEAQYSLLIKMTKEKDEKALEALTKSDPEAQQKIMMSMMGATKACVKQPGVDSVKPAEEMKEEAKEEAPAAEEAAEEAK